MTIDLFEDYYADILDYNEDLTYSDGANKLDNIIKVYDKDMNLLWNRYEVYDKHEEKSFEGFINFIELYLGVKLAQYQKEMLRIIYNENIK